MLFCNVLAPVSLVNNSYKPLFNFISYVTPAINAAWQHYSFFSVASVYHFFLESRIHNQTLASSGITLELGLRINIMHANTWFNMFSVIPVVNIPLHLLRSDRSRLLLHEHFFPLEGNRYDRRL
jgi:hypothetical protein